ncbi:MAG: helix-turn-helix domain-containing protein [Oscillospiraceae bacterium]|jgi:transcriptional regulator with XRE-family HTH domain|nr:helix-turn-helix domain-containing protein [Oscillospiraceae bacterium]
MNMADRIQYLRKTKGISQEELADQVGVSRQAVSKWESEQSAPDLDRIIAMSELFGVTTDYILKGIEPVAPVKGSNLALASKINYLGSTLFLAIGLLAALATWHAEQTMESVWGGMIIQAVGVMAYFVGRALSKERAPFAVDWLNIVLGLFMPVSMGAGALAIALFRQGWVAPYPIGVWHVGLFVLGMGGMAAVSWVWLKRRPSGRGLSR